MSQAKIMHIPSDFNDNRLPSARISFLSCTCYLTCGWSEEVETILWRYSSGTGVSLVLYEHVCKAI